MQTLVTNGEVGGYCVGGLGYNGYGYRDRNDNCEALEAALHITSKLSDVQTDVNGNITAQGLQNLDASKENLKAIYDSENDVRTHLNSSTLQTLGAIQAAENHVGNTVSQNGMANLEATRNIGSTLAQEICDVSKDTIKGHHLLSKEIGDVSKDIIRGQHFLSKEIGDVGKDLGKDISDVQYNLANIGSDIRRELAKESCDIKTSLGDKFATLLLENHKAESRTREELLKGFHATQLDACKNTNEITRQADANFAKLQLQNCELENRLAKQIAECCCENKLLTQAQSAETRELFLKQELADERRRNDDHHRGSIDITINNAVNSALLNVLNRTGGGNGNGNGH